MNLEFSTIDHQKCIKTAKDNSQPIDHLKYEEYKERSNRALDGRKQSGVNKNQKKYIK